MGIFDAMRRDGHEQLIFCAVKEAGLRGLIAIHDTTLGPAMGGCRMWPYATEEEAVADALRLSQGMSYKSAVANSNYGGGKAVIWGDPATDKSEELFRALGRFVEGMGGRFITGTDVGTSAWDFVWTGRETRHVVALPEQYGGSGDTSVTTAFGVLMGIKACVREALGQGSLKGVTVALQGVGKVGEKLLAHLLAEGAEVVVADTDPARVERVCAAHGVKSVPADQVYDQPCQVFSPNALGGVLNDATIPRLRCRIVAGGANNQLAEDRHGDMLQERGILYAPDFVINAGGLIQVCEEREGFDRDRAFRRAAGIYDALLRIFAISRERGVPTHRAANMLAEERMARIGALDRIYVP
ncbi:MAG: hypothetical protein K6T75_07880 [Acetobacteraceae bacterium]|nr:hypothetical protein [Acetobacteraceae bacterium]